MWWVSHSWKQSEGESWKEGSGSGGGWEQQQLGEFWRDVKWSTVCNGEWRPRNSQQLPNIIALERTRWPKLFFVLNLVIFLCACFLLPICQKTLFKIFTNMIKKAFVFVQNFLWWEKHRLSDVVRFCLFDHFSTPRTRQGVPIRLLKSHDFVWVNRLGAKRAPEHDNIMSWLIIALSQADNAAIVNSHNIGSRKQRQKLLKWAAFKEKWTGRNMATGNGAWMEKAWHFNQGEVNVHWLPVEEWKCNSL